MYAYLRLTVAVAALSLTAVSLADTRADSHAPIGVMGDHIHAKGEWMVSYRFMNMPMEGNLVGDNSISADDIATTIPNRFFGTPGQPPTLRVVPTDMDMTMHMLGLMYAPSDRITLMAMLNYVGKDMDHTTYQGGMGTTVLGTFTTETSGLGDGSVAALIGLIDDPDFKVHATVGVSLPLGDIEERDEILTPMNMRPTPRLPYPMQLGSGTWDPILGVTVSRYGERFGFGGQWRSTFRFSDNDEDYRLGDEHRLTAWASYSPMHSLSFSLRAEYRDLGEIDGIDAAIVAPVQTADPDRQGGERLDLGVGVNYALAGNLEGWRLALEYLVPVQQDLNGPQLEVDNTLTLGVQKAW